MRVYAESSEAIVNFDFLYHTHLTPETTGFITEFFDPDGDGLLRGVADAHLPGRIDSDGDGLSEFRVDEAGVMRATANDNCAPALDPSPDELARFANPTQLDRDGDGIGDACDVCPTVYDPEQTTCRSTVSVEAEESPTGRALAVGDPVGVACILPAQRRDRDGDGAFDLWCDNCVPTGGIFDERRTSNPDQLDTDGDGIGDVCDVCPSDPDPLVSDPRTGDEDRDGHGDFCGDNCVGVRNPLQENCNAAAEVSLGLFDPITLDPPGVGDACDPIPCGETRLERITQPPIGDIGTSNAHEIVVDPRSDDNLRDVRTGFRFCRCSAATTDTLQTHLNCTDGVPPDGGCLIDNRASYDVLITDELQEPLDWRSMAVHDHVAPVGLTSLVDPDAGGIHEGLRVEATLRRFLRQRTGDGFDVGLEAIWSSTPDRSRWNRVFEEDVGELHGVLWTHAPGRNADFFALSTRMLSHHYWSGFVPPEIDTPGPFPCLRYVGPWIGSAGCPLCSNAFPAPFFGSPGTIADLGCGGPFQPPIVELPGPPIEVDDFFAVDPRAAFERADLTWIAAAEPLEWVGEQATVLVGLDPDLSPAVVVGQDPSGLFLVDDQGNQCPTPNNCDRPPPPPVVQIANAPAEPTECVSVLSAREGELYTLAGDADSRIGKIHRRSATIGDEGTSASAGIGHVLAATYRPDDRFLYVIDEVRTSRRTFVRLVQLAPEGGTRVLLRWPRLAHHSVHHLAPSTGGGLWMLASHRHGAHVIVHFEKRRRWIVGGWRLAADPLASSTPRVDARGISYVVVGDEREEVRGATLNDLWRFRRRHGSRCF